MIAPLSGVVLGLIVCHTPKTVINIYECYQVLIATLRTYYLTLFNTLQCNGGVVYSVPSMINALHCHIKSL